MLGVHFCVFFVYFSNKLQTSFPLLLCFCAWCIIFNSFLNCGICRIIYYVIPISVIIFISIIFLWFFKYFNRGTCCDVFCFAFERVMHAYIFILFIKFMLPTVILREIPTGCLHHTNFSSMRL